MLIMLRLILKLSKFIKRYAFIRFNCEKHAFSLFSKIFGFRQKWRNALPDV